MIQKNETVIYIALVLFSSGLIAFLAQIAGNANLSIFSVFTPSLLALLVVTLSHGKEAAKDLFVWRLVKPFGLGWLVFALTAFPGAGLAAVIIHSLIGGPSPGFRTTQLMPQIIVILAISVGEEFGWRGYLLPKLQVKCSALVASVILGVVWGLWHFPAYLLGTGVPQEMSFSVFMVWVLLATIVMTFVYNNTSSVFLAIIMHSTANLTFNYLPLLPEFVGQTITFYIFLSLVGVLVTILISNFGSRNLRLANHE